MTFFSKRKFAFFLCIIFVLTLSFGACGIKEDSQKSRELCEAMLDNVIQNDYIAAYTMIQEVASQEEFDALWKTMREVLKDSKSYKIQQKNWYRHWINGETTVQVLFEIATDDGKICQILIYTSENIGGIAGMNFVDSTEFVRKTNFLTIVNAFLILFSLACFAFSIWMLVDCLKRNPKNKILWAILTLFYAGGNLTVGTSVFNIRFRISLLSGITSVVTDRTAFSVTVTALLPIGALIYFLMRKRLSGPSLDNAENSNETDVNSSPVSSESSNGKNIDQLPEENTAVSDEDNTSQSSDETNAATEEESHEPAPEENTESTPVEYKSRPLVETIELPYIETIELPYSETLDLPVGKRNDGKPVK